MYSLTNIKISSKKELNKYYSDEYIMTFYFGDYELNTHYLSPLRDDKAPSFYITYYNGELKWRDFGIGPSPKNPVEFVALMKGITFTDALTVIYNEIKSSTREIHVRDRPVFDDLTYEIKIAEITEKYQLDYWTKGGITKETLDLFKVKWCKQLWINDKLKGKSSSTYPMYFYDHSETPFDESWTVYSPYAKPKDKFRKRNINGRVMGLNLIPPSGELLFITKSYKDIMILHEIGFYAIAPHSENIRLSESLINDLKNRFNKIYVNYDNDNTGVSSSIELTKEYNLNYWNIPKSMNCKDPYACSCIYGLSKVKELILNKIERDNKNDNCTRSGIN